MTALYTALENGNHSVGREIRSVVAWSEGEVERWMGKWQRDRTAPGGDGCFTFFVSLVDSRRMCMSKFIALYTFVRCAVSYIGYAPIKLYIKKAVVLKERVTIYLIVSAFIKECKQQITKTKENKSLQNTHVKQWFPTFQNHCPLQDKDFVTPPLLALVEQTQKVWRLWLEINDKGLFKGFRACKAGTC